MNNDQLQINNHRMEAIVERAHDGIISVNPEGEITFINLAACSMFGYTAEEASQLTLDALIPAKYRANHHHYVDDFRASQSLSRTMHGRSSVKGIRRDETIFPLEISISKIIVDAKMEMVAVIRDVSDRSSFIEELREAATVDHLTGLANRRAFNEELVRHIALTNRYGRQLSLIIGDLDFFKGVNDKYGHASGDEVLKGFASAVKEEIRDTDLAARWGGEEFALLLPETDLAGAVVLAEKLRERCASYRFQFQGEDVQVTCSFGVVEMYYEKDDIVSLFDRADKLLYHAKQSGRNCVASQNQ